jgi:hypothetical protein
MNIPRQGFERVCWNKELRMDQTDAAVWQEVCRLLENPERLEQEYRQRLQPQQQPKEHEGLEAQMSKLRRGIARLIDSYAEGLIDKQEFEPRVTRMRERMQHLEEQLQRLKEESEVDEELRLILGRLETFAAKVKEGLHQADFQTRRDIIRTLVKRVEVDEQHIRIVFRVSPMPFPPSSDGASHNWQDCGRRVLAPGLQPVRRRAAGDLSQRPAHESGTWPQDRCQGQSVACRLAAAWLDCRPSFIPPKPVRELRDLMRYRKTIVQERAYAGLSAAKSARDGQSQAGIGGYRCAGEKRTRVGLDALLGGQDDPQTLAELARGRLRAKLPD